jgi:excisionase family DNA binding protein
MLDNFDNRDMTVEDVAAKYGLQSGTVRRTIHLGNIPARKSGKNWLIKHSDAEARWGNGKLKPGPKAKAK